MNGWVAGKQQLARCFLLGLTIAVLSPATSLGADPSEVPDVFDRTIWGYSFGYPVFDPERGWVNGGSAFGDSPASACAAAGGSLQFNGCGISIPHPSSPWISGGAVHYSPCPPGYRRSTSSYDYHRKCVRIPITWADPGQDPGRVPGEPEVCVGNPCDPATGNKYQVEVDYVGGGPFPLRFVRYYNSMDLTEEEDAPRLGTNWRTNLDRKVSLFRIGETDFVSIRNGPGRSVRMKGTSGGWEGDPDISISVERSPSLGWKVRNEQDEIEEYSGDGQLIKLTNRAGLSHTFSYYLNGLLWQVKDSFGRALTFTHDSIGRFVTMTDPSGGVYRYRYDTGGLKSVTYPDGSVRTYNYNQSAYTSGATLTTALTSILDENGSTFAIFRYAATRKAIGSEHAGAAEKVSLSYNSDTLTEVTDALGTKRQFEFEMAFGVKRNVSVRQPCPDCADGVASRTSTYDADGNVSAATDFNGRLTCYAYDAVRKLEIRRTEGLSGSTCPGTPTSATRTVTTEWHPTHHLPLRVAEPLAITAYTYDEATGYTLSKSIQATDDTTGEAGFSGAATGEPRVWSYTYSYDTSTPGLVRELTLDGPRTDVADTTTYAFDEQGNLVSIRNALADTETFDEYDANGHPGRHTDANGLVTTFAYDLRGRLTSRDAGGEVTAYEYDRVGQLVKVTRPDGAVLTYSYDAAHRLTQIQDGSGSRIVYTLDAMGNRVKEDVHDPSGVLTRTHRREFDALNRLAREIGATTPAAQITHHQYDPVGNPVATTDPLGRIRSMSYDALDRLVAVTEPDEGVVRLGYDLLDRLASVTDPRGLTTTYQRDGLGNLSGQSSPDTGITSNAYDAPGNLVSSTDARGVVSTYSYDALNRLTRAVFTPPSGSTLTTISHTYEYDQGQNGIGRLTRIVDPTSTTSFAYDAHGRLTQDTRLIAGVSYATAYRYDAAGRLGGMTYPSGRKVDYTLDSLGRVSAITTTRGGTTHLVLAAASYRPSGELQSFVFGNGQPCARSFDLDGRVTGYTLGERTQALTWDPANRVTVLGDAAEPAKATQLRYDPLDRLTSFLTPSTSQAFTYDAVGNRLTQSIGANTYGYTYPQASNRLSSVSGPPAARAYSYDTAGNPAAAGSHILIHDARGRLAQVVNAASGALLARYQVSAQGQRVAKTANQAGTAYHYDAAGHLIAETAITGHVLKEYLWLGDMPVGLIDADADNDAIFDSDDNCLGVPNSAQVDSDHDGYGNACDTDLNNNGFVNATDLGLFKAAFGMRIGQSGFNPAADFNADGMVNVLDLAVLKASFGKSPGPSALHGQAAAPVLYYIHTDHLNTPRALASPTGGTVWRWMPLDPFGSNYPEEDPDGDGERVTLNLRFPGQYFDRETGLHYNYYRDYDPRTGRYIQSDPIGLDGGINTYAYVGGNPLSFVDPLGLVEAPGLGESVIPIWGSGKQALHDFECGRWGWGLFNTAMAASDVLLVKAAVTGLARGALKAGSHKWGATRDWYGDTRGLTPGTPVHHWAIPQGGWGESVPNAIKNQPWNLMPMESQAFHNQVHGWGPDAFNAAERAWYGTPQWAKAAAASGAGRAANAARDGRCGCD